MATWPELAEGILSGTRFLSTPFGGLSTVVKGHAAGSGYFQAPVQAFRRCDEPLICVYLDSGQVISSLWAGISISCAEMRLRPTSSIMIR